MVTSWMFVALLFTARGAELTGACLDGPFVPAPLWQKEEVVNRDKFGPTGGHKQTVDSQTKYLQELTMQRSLEAEREGFSDGLPAADSRSQQTITNKSITSIIGNAQFANYRNSSDSERHKTATRIVPI